MIRAIAKWWAKRSYIWDLEVEASKSEINAGTANRNAEAKRKLVAQLNAEADAIEENVKTVETEEEVRKTAPEYQQLSAQEKYEDERAAKKEKDAAMQIMSEKRELAKQEQENVDAAIQAVNMLSGRAQDSRNFADKIREL
jgi:hypothetical protein